MQTSRGRGGFSDSTRGAMVVLVLMMEVGGGGVGGGKAGVHTTELPHCC